MGHVPNSEHSTAAFPAESRAPGQSGNRRVCMAGRGPHREKRAHQLQYCPVNLVACAYCLRMCPQTDHNVCTANCKPQRKA